MAAGRAIVIGGGLAGLSAAWHLSRGGVETIVLERKSSAGGRAASAPDPVTREPIDTGQHVFMGCYRATLGWLESLGTRDRIAFQPRLEVPYRRAGGESRTFRAADLPAGLHLLGGIWAMRDLSLAEKLGSLSLAWAVWAGRDLDTMTVRQWLDALKTPAPVRELLLEPLATAALNEDPGTVSALPFAATLRELMLGGRRGSSIGFATTGLSDTYAGSARAQIEQAGGKVREGAWATELAVSGGAVAGVKLAGGGSLEADVVISTVPPWALPSLVAGVPALRSLSGAAEKFKPSPIISVHLWFDRTVLPEPFCGLIGSKFHWLFNRTAHVGPGKGGAQHLCLVTSGARDLLGIKPGALAGLGEEEVRRFVPEAGGAKVVNRRVVWDPKATVSLAPGTGALRPGPATEVRNFVMAGDWSDTGLPATIESAVRSGVRAARHVLSLGT